MEENNISQETPKRFNPLIVIGIVTLVILVGVLGFLNLNKKQNVSGDNVAASGPVKEFSVVGTNYAFDPATITVNKGDTVKIDFKDEDGTHNLIVEGYNVYTQTVRGGGADSVQFVADKTGTFNYYCSVASHRALGMEGTLIVK